MCSKIFDQPGNTPVEYIDTFENNIQLFVKREDLIHAEISGNKWRKLKYNLAEAGNLGYTRVITFGGAFSNHIHATAAAGAACDLDTVGIIRGEIIEPLNATLRQSKEWGMRLQSISREQYKKKSDPEYLDRLQNKFGPAYIIPEGGANQLGLKGVSEMTEISDRFNFWCVSCGTGTTLAGLVTGLSKNEVVLGFPALKGGEYLEHEIDKLLRKAGTNPKVSWELFTNYHFGGYAKISEELIEFIRMFRNSYGIILDPIYTGKMLFGVVDLIVNGYFPAESRILAIHSGGLQGVTGIEEKYGIRIK
ncbi:MAG: 1-aminocyclopropane-1-carboxylate deaminase [Cyclobacteriaceae bacterium]|nr:MAG: 1-aminocyclopropane-1-carboxylate deaminase [Cyclobacteriaceae bacterium]